jgi:single-stranded DNA-binding protein
VYRNVAENMINSGFKKGDLITVTNAPIYLRKYQTDQGENRISVEVEAKEVGASLTFRTYPHHDRSTGKQQPPAQDGPPQDGNPVDTPAWATPGSESRDYGWGGTGEL